MNLEKYDKAMQDINRALELEPNKANAFGSRGILYLRMKQQKKACLDLHKATELGCDQTKLINENCK